MTAEVWIHIYDVDSDFSVSDHGRVRNNDTGRILTERRNPRGYVTYRLMSDGRMREFTAHRLVARHFIGEPTGPVVRHLDDVKTNNHVSNLAYGTQAENMQDAIRNGTVGAGIRKQMTHCRRRGHEMTPENRYVYGSRPFTKCNACRVIEVHERVEAKKAVTAAKRAAGKAS